MAVTRRQMLQAVPLIAFTPTVRRSSKISARQYTEDLAAAVTTRTYPYHSGNGRFIELIETKHGIVHGPELVFGVRRASGETSWLVASHITADSVQLTLPHEVPIWMEFIGGTWITVVF